MRPAALVLPTPHPLSLALGAVSWLVPGVDPRTTWVVLSLVALVSLLAGCQQLVLDRASEWLPVACVPLLVVSLPAVAAVVENGTVDIVFAAAGVWAAVLAKRRPAVALVLAAVATLVRPEGMILVALVLFVRDRAAGRGDGRWLVAAGSIALALAVIWVVMGAVLFGDPWAALHVTVSNAHRTHDPGGLRSFWHALLHGAGVVPGAFILAGVIWIGLARKRSLGTAVSVASVLMTAGVGAAAWSGAEIPTRYLALELALGIGVVTAQLVSACPAGWRRSAVVSVVVALTGSSILHGLHDRRIYTGDVRTAARAMSLADGALHAATGCSSISVAPTPFLPALLLEDTRLTVSSVPSGACRLVARSLPVAAGEGWGPVGSVPVAESVPPAASILAVDADWLIYVR